MAKKKLKTRKISLVAYLGGDDVIVCTPETEDYAITLYFGIANGRDIRDYTRIQDSDGTLEISTRYPIFNVQ